MASKKKGAFGVIVSVQGQAPRIVEVGSGATVRSALIAAKLDPDTLGGSLTVDHEAANLADRLSKDAFIQVSPKVAGGR